MNPNVKWFIAFVVVLLVAGFLSACAAPPAPQQTAAVAAPVAAANPANPPQEKVWSKCEHRGNFAWNVAKYRDAGYPKEMILQSIQMAPYAEPDAGYTPEIVAEMTALATAIYDNPQVTPEVAEAMALNTCPQPLEGGVSL